MTGAVKGLIPTLSHVSFPSHSSALPPIPSPHPHTQMTFSQMQSSSAPSIAVASYDELGVTLSFNSGAAPGGPTMVVPLVRGTPYLSFNFSGGAQPLLRSPGGGISSVTPVSPNKLRLVVGGSPAPAPQPKSHTWLLYSPVPVSYSFSGGLLRVWDATAPDQSFKGVLRLAWLSPSYPGAEAMLDAYSDAVPVGGSSSAWVTGDTGTYQLTFTAVSSATGAALASPGAQLLMLALPHHMDSITFPNRDDTGSYPLGVDSGYITSVRGPMVPVVGDTWQLSEALPPVKRELAASRITDPAKRAAVEAALLVRHLCAAGNSSLSVTAAPCGRLLGFGTLAAS